MYSYLDHRFPVGFAFAFIPWQRILGTVVRGGARVQNLGHLNNMIDTMINFLYVSQHPQSLVRKHSYLDLRHLVRFSL